MSWVFQENAFVDGTPLDVDDLNANLSRFASAMSGNLGEHNWLIGCFEGFVTDEKADPGFAVMSEGVILELDPHDVVADLIEVTQSTAWRSVEGAEVEWDSMGGTALVSFSFQARMASLTGQSGLNFAIEVDGVVQLGGLLGTGDASNDYLDSKANVRFAGIVDPTDVVYDYGSSPSLRSFQIPLCVEVVVPIQPGRHLAKLMARNLFLAETVTQHVANCEGTAFDLWA